MERASELGFCRKGLILAYLKLLKHYEDILRENGRE